VAAVFRDGDDDSHRHAEVGVIRPGIKKLFRLAFHRRDDALRDVRDEVRLHIELRTEQLIGGGMSPEAARAKAARRFGTLDAAQRAMESTAAHREAKMRMRDRVESFLQDLRYVFRSLRRTPTFVISATLTLALGLGANAALFSILDRLYLQAPAGVTAPDQLRRIYEPYMVSTVDRRVQSVLMPPEYLAVAAAMPKGTSIVGYATDARAHLGKDDSAPQGGVTAILGDYFGVLGVHPTFGRNFTEEEVAPQGITTEAIVSNSFAQNQFGSASAAIDKVIDLGTLRLTIIGVAPPGFIGTDLATTVVWIPMNTRSARPLGPGAWYEDTHNGFISTIVRAPNAASLQAVGTVATAALRRATQLRDTSAVSASFGSIREMLSPGFDAGAQAIATRLAVVAFAILLIACANVANLLLARALQRRREIGVRLALGVSRTRLIAQLLTESVVLAMLGGVASAIVAIWCATTLRHALLPDVQWGAPAIGMRAVLFGALTTLIAGVAAGLAPALHASRPNLTTVLRGGQREGNSHRSTGRGMLLVSQIALSCVLLAGAGLFVRSLRQVEAIDIGYDTDRIVLAGVDFMRGSGRRAEERGPLFAAAASRIEKLPGVERVAFTANTPMSSFGLAETFLPNGDTLKGPRNMDTIVSSISPGFFGSMGMHVIAGRDFSLEDRDGAEPVIVVNASFAKAIWPGQSAVGQCFRLEAPTAPCRRVVGVVSNSHFGSVIEAPSMQFYVPLAQRPGDTHQNIPGTMEIRAADGRTSQVAAQVKQLLTQLSGTGMRPWTETLSEELDPGMRRWRLGAALFTAAGLLALLVAAVGIYGTIAYTFSQRTQEIGVRIALGAQGSSIIALVLKSSVAIAAIGVIIGTGIALWAGKFAKPLLYDTAPNNPFVLGGIALVLLGVAVVASLVPAIRAKSVDPLEALRAE
jgi:putative ABC transport system permease protein